MALALVAITFGLQSAIDWTWFVPGPTAMALVAAGYVAGRGPVTALAVPGAQPVAPRRPTARPRARGGRRGMGVAAILVAWAIWQPEASQNAVGRALELADQGRYEEAYEKTEGAADADPLSPAPLLARAQVEATAGLDRQAARTLERAVLKFPGDPTPGWSWRASSCSRSTARGRRSRRCAARCTSTRTRRSRRALWLHARSAVRRRRSAATR